MGDVKKYYVNVERIDYVEIFDHFKGTESIFHRIRERVIRKLLKKYTGGSLFIDVGCGTGLILRHLPSGSVGLDINPWAVKRAKRYAQTAELVVADAENIPFKEGAFSTVVCSEVLEHLEHPFRAVEEIYRILKEGGVLVGSVPHPSFMWKVVEWGHVKLSKRKYRSLLSKIHVISSARSHFVPIHKLYTLREVHKVLSIFDILRNSPNFLRLYIFFAAQKHSR